MKALKTSGIVYEALNEIKAAGEHPSLDSVVQLLVLAHKFGYDVTDLTDPDEEITIGHAERHSVRVSESTHKEVDRIKREEGYGSFDMTLRVLIARTAPRRIGTMLYGDGAPEAE